MGDDLDDGLNDEFAEGKRPGGRWVLLRFVMILGG